MFQLYTLLFAISTQEATSNFRRPTGPTRTGHRPRPVNKLSSRSPVGAKIYFITLQNNLKSNTSNELYITYN
jgi:hypothetical protein